MAEAAYAAGPAHLAILGDPRLIPKKVIQMNNSQSSQNYEKFRTGTFLVVIDSLEGELRKRLNAYANIAGRFGFLRKLADLSNEEVIESAKSLQEAFARDLEASLSDELLQCSSFLNTEFAKKALKQLLLILQPQLYHWIRRMTTVTRKMIKKLT